MCPTGAIPPYNPDQIRRVDMGERVFEYGGTHWAKCRIMCHGTYAEYNPTGRDLFPRDAVNPLSSDLAPAMGYFAKNPGNEWIQHNPTYKCGNCLAYCPVGNWRERFYDTGISSVDTSVFIEEGAPDAVLPVAQQRARKEAV
jgi:ferredoxin